MAATIDTQFGEVSTSAPYFSHVLGCRVVNMTLVKPENKANGWGISRECPADISLTPEFLNMFAREATNVM